MMSALMSTFNSREMTGILQAVRVAKSRAEKVTFVLKRNKRSNLTLGVLPNNAVRVSILCIYYIS
jgi:hypothetical protein